MPRAAQSYRFGGEATLPSIIVAEARLAFLWAVDELYPEVLDELVEAAAAPGLARLAGYSLSDFRYWLADPLSAPAGWDKLLEAIEAWARRWRLRDRGHVPPWLLHAALNAISRHQAHGCRWWSVGWGGAVPDSCEVLPPIALTPEVERALPAGLRRILTVVSRDGGAYIGCNFSPAFDGAGRFKRALRKYAHSVLRAWHVSAEQACRRIDQTVAAALARGCVPGQWRAERRIVYWAARAVVGREAYEDIANDPNRGVTDRRERISPPTVRNQVSEFLALINLRRRPGPKDR
jgi:hypothetical protein